MMRTTFEIGDWLFDFIEQYSQFVRPDNWYTFWPIFIELENDVIMGGVEFTFVVLGLGIRVRWNHTETEDMKHCINALKKIKNTQ